MSSEVEEQKKIQEKILEIESMAKKFMTQEAIERYGRLKSAHQQAMVLIAHLGSQNQIKEKITDEQFKDILMRLEPEKRETKIIRK